MLPKVNPVLAKSSLQSAGPPTGNLQNILLLKYWFVISWNPRRWFWTYIYILPSLHLFTSLTLCRLPILFRFLHLLLQLAQTTAEQNNVGESLEDVDNKEDNADKKNVMYMPVTFVKIFPVWQLFIWPVSNIHNDCTICNIQFNDLKSLNHHFFFKHKL